MGWFLGGLDGFLYALLMFVVIDYATGLMAAFVQKKISSEVGFKGICKKVAIFCLVGIGHVLDTHPERKCTPHRSHFLLLIQ